MNVRCHHIFILVPNDIVMKYFDIIEPFISFTYRSENNTWNIYVCMSLPLFLLMNENKAFRRPRWYLFDLI